MAQVSRKNILLSLLVVLLIGTVGLGIDRLARQLHDQEVRLEVSARLEALRTGMESEIDAAVRATRSLAALVSGEGEISQARYANFASEITGDLPGVINIAWAPDLVITHVYPLEGNEAVIGLDYRALPDQIDVVLEVRDTGTMAFVGPLDLIQGPRGLILRLPVFVPSDDGPRFSGILSMVFDLDKFIRSSEAEGQALGLDVALTTDAGAYGPDEAVVGNPGILADNPANAILVLPEREWTLHARPMGGWAAAQSRNVSLRVSFLALVLLTMVVCVSAIWLASSRNRTMERIRTADKRLEGVVRNAPGVFFALHENAVSDGLVMDYISETCRELWGYGPDDFYEEPELIGQLMEQEQHGPWMTEIGRARENMSRWNYTWKTTTASGEEKWLQGWGHPSRLDTGEMRWDNFVVDVTESREKDIQFERQAKIVYQTQKQESIGHLTGGVAHDFNNLLAVIMGNLELLRDETSDPEHLELIDSSLNATRRGASLTGNMLAFARKAQLEPRVIDLNRVVTETCNWISRTLPETIDVETSLLAGLWKIEADPGSTESALLNLVLNARDAMPKGGKLTIETSNVRIDETLRDTRHEDLTPGRYVMLAISDSGHGIDARTLSRIFEPFFSTKPPSSGSGLGLSMVQGFMHQSGGTVRVYSEPGTGTTFKLYFRALTGDHEASEPETPASDTVSTGAHRILLAEDEADVRRVLVRILEKAGYSVVVATSGDEALETFEASREFDLLVTDIVMPGRLQGPALSRELRDRHPGFPVVFMSGYASEATVHGNGLRPEDIRLMKPVLRDDLLRAIRKSLKDSGQPGAVRRIRTSLSLPRNA